MQRGRALQGMEAFGIFCQAFSAKFEKVIDNLCQIRRSQIMPNSETCANLAEIAIFAEFYSQYPEALTLKDCIVHIVRLCSRFNKSLTFESFDAAGHGAVVNTISQ